MDKLLFFSLNVVIQSIVSQNTNTIKIEEANIQFVLSDSWEFVSKTGKLDWGKVQYSYTHEHVQGNGRLVNPTIIVTADKGSYFTDEKNYVSEKMDFHQMMDDEMKIKFTPEDESNPLEVKAYYIEGLSGTQDSPYGQKVGVVSFWTESLGFHFQLQTSIKDWEKNKEAYEAILSSIRLAE